MPNLLRVWLSIICLALLGIVSGMPMSLVTSGLSAWVTSLDLGMKLVGGLASISTVYALKFLWAPLLDRFFPPYLGRRRGWMLVFQLLMGGTVVLIGVIGPESNLWLWILLCTLLAVFSASFDSVFDAYRTEMLPSTHRGIGTAFSVFGYRLGMWFASAIGLLMSHLFGWGTIYIFMGGVILCLSVFTLLAPDPLDAAEPPTSLKQAVREPFIDFFTRPGAWLILILLIVYKLSDAFTAAFGLAFLMKGTSFTAVQIAQVNQTFGLIMATFGVFLGGILLRYVRLFYMLLVCALLQAISNVAYLLIAQFPSSMDILWIGLGVENLVAGLTTAAFVSLLMGLCNHQFTATQYALFSAMATVARTLLIGPLFGVVLDKGWLTWSEFFMVSIVAGVPAFIFVWLCKETILRVEQGTQPSDRERV